MQNPPSLEYVCDLIDPDDFTDPRNKEIYAAIIALDRKGKTPDFISVSDHIQQHGGKTQLADITTIVQSTPTVADAQHYAQVIRDQAAERRMLQGLNDGIQIIKSPGEPKAKFDKIEQLIMSATHQREITGALPLQKALPDLLTEMERRMECGGVSGLSTGLPKLDKALNGLHKSNLIIAAGRPSMGKTTLAMNIAENAAIRGDSNVLIFSLEMSAQQLTERMFASLTGIHLNKIIDTSQLSDPEWARITGASRLITEAGNRFQVDETAGLSIHQIRQRARRVYKNHPLSLIVVDYLQLARGEGENQNHKITDITQGLKALAKELNVPVLCLSQLNRSVEQRTDKRPLMSDLRDSGSIEQDADVILMLYRAEQYARDPDEQERLHGVADILIRKNRQGQTGAIQVAFVGGFNRFEHSEDFIDTSPPKATVSDFQKKYERK